MKTRSPLKGMDAYDDRRTDWARDNGEAEVGLGIEAAGEPVLEGWSVDHAVSEVATDEDEPDWLVRVSNVGERHRAMPGVDLQTYLYNA